MRSCADDPLTLSPHVVNAHGAEAGGTHAQALQEVVSSVRNARAEYGVELGRKIPAQLIVADAKLSSALQAEMPVLCSLAKLDEAQVMLAWNLSHDERQC